MVLNVHRWVHRTMWQTINYTRTSPRLFSYIRFFLAQGEGQGVNARVKKAFSASGFQLMIFGCKGYQVSR